MTAAHRPDSLPDAFVRHAARLPFVLIGAPLVPPGATRTAAQHAALAVADSLGATTPMPLEDRRERWPGVFEPNVPVVNRSFSLLWILPATGLVLAFARGRQLVAALDGRMALVTLALGLTFIVGTAVSVRWQAASGIPDRLIVPGMVMAGIGAAWIAHLVAPQATYRSRWQVALLALLALHTLPFINLVRHSIVHSPAQAAARARQRTPLGPAADAVPPGSRVLLLAGHGASDYLLFHPARGFPTRVVPWGRRAFDAASFEAALLRANADTVVIEAPDVLAFHWHPSVQVRPFVEFLTRQAGFERLANAGPALVFVR
jgi:hypothetical protein